MRYRQRKEFATIPEEEWNGTEQRRNTVDTMSVLIFYFDYVFEFLIY